MKFKFSLVLLFMISFPLIGQGKEESFWKKFVDEDVSKLHLQDLEKTDYTIAIRIWKPFQVVELINVNDTVYQGQLVNFVTELNHREIKKRVISEKLTIPSSVTKTLIDQLRTENIETLPDSYDVEDYVNGLDGITYIFEILSENKYRVYSYWEPENDHYQNLKIREVRSVRNILSAINRQFSSTRLFILFRDSLPAGKYQFGDLIMVVPRSR